MAPSNHTSIPITTREEWEGHAAAEQAKGGRKDDSGKLRYDLIPVGPLRKVAEVYTTGAKKYDDRNWEKGIDWGRIYGALQRHANAWWGGEVHDRENGQHHLASVVWCALALMEYEMTHLEDDPRPDKYEPKTGRVFPWPAANGIVPIPAPHPNPPYRPDDTVLYSVPPEDVSQS